MMQSNEYWAKRQEAAFSKTLTQTRDLYKKAYREALEGTQRDIERLYDTLIQESIDGKIKMNDLYRYNRYFELQGQLNKRLIALGEKERLITDEKLLLMYDRTQDLVTKIAAKELGVNLVLDSPGAAQVAVDSIWCADGAHWSKRIWKQKDLLQQHIEKGFVDCVARGVSKDELVKQLQANFNQSFYCSDRIARTELTYIQNKSAADRYKANGIKQYKYLAALDGRTSDTCKELNGKIFNFSEMAVGVNCPPTHPNCRCTIIPIVTGG